MSAVATSYSIHASQDCKQSAHVSMLICRYSACSCRTSHQGLVELLVASHCTLQPQAMLLASHCKAWCGMTERGVATLGSTTARLLCQTMLWADLKAAACSPGTLQGLPQCFGHPSSGILPCVPWQNVSHQWPPQAQVAASQCHNKPRPGLSTVVCVMVKASC